MYNNRTYAIVDLVTWNEALSASGQPLNTFYELILETSPETLKYSVCSDAFIIKSDDQTNIATLTSFAEGYNVDYTLYNHQDALQVIATSAWTIPPEFQTVSINISKVKKIRKKRKKRTKISNK